jgi:hypothetical protein
VPAAVGAELGDEEAAACEAAAEPREEAAAGVVCMETPSVIQAMAAVWL